jgi:protein-tyrosine phosphatase
MLFPLRFAFERPEVAGFNGWLLARLTAFDLPFNQAPSLHVSLLLILWVHYLGILKGKWQWLLSIWFALIGVSVVGTWQHHMLDVYAGLVAGVLCLYLVPRSGLAESRHSLDPGRKRIGAWYAAGAMASTVLWAGMVGVGAPWFGLLFAWTALALALVALGYLRVGAQVLQKRNGVIAWPARLVLAPYLLGARVSVWLQTRGHAPYAQVADDLFIGSLPGTLPPETTAVLDLTAEFSRVPSTVGLKYLNVLVLDLTAPTVAQLQCAAGFIDAERAAGGRILVHCALGLSRSACAVAAAEIVRGVSVEVALAAVHAAQPRAVLRPAHVAALHRLV